jgi:hypothetical protein
MPPGDGNQMNFPLRQLQPFNPMHPAGSHHRPRRSSISPTPAYYSVKLQKSAAKEFLCSAKRT